MKEDQLPSALSDLAAAEMQREEITGLQQENAALRAEGEENKLEWYAAIKDMRIALERAEKAEAEVGELTRELYSVRQGLKMTSETAQQDLRRAIQAEAKLAKVVEALERLTTDSALQGRIFKGNAELPGCEDFYRGYNSGIEGQFKYARDIALTALAAARGGTDE